MIFFILALFTLQVNAQTPETKSPPAAAEAVPAPTSAPVESAEPAAKESSDYEVDYEEEPGTEDTEEPEEEKPVKVKAKKSKGKKNTKESVSQGSIASKKFAPLMKSETKSIYKKNGKALDVDSD